MKKRRISVVAVLVCMIPSLFAAGILPARAEDVRAWSGSGQAPWQIAEKVGQLGVRLKTRADVTAFSFSMPTWSVSGVYEADLSVYVWDGSFRKTVSARPLLTQRFKALVDNASNRVSMPEPLPAGEYLFVIENTAGQVGCWVADPSGGNTVLTYSDGVESRCEPFLTLTFSGAAPAKPFDEVKSMEDSYGTAPVWEEPQDDPTDLSGLVPADSLYNQNRAMPDTWVFTDGLGRKSLTYADVGEPRDGKTLALFYWTWHVSQGAGNKPFNVQNFLDEEAAKGTDLSAIINNYSYSGWPGAGYQYFWDEPIYGYYRTNDEWVLRRQAELLADAGVDVVFTDNTNGTFTWRDSYVPLFETWTGARKAGVAAPKISFMLPFSASDDSKTQLRSLYLDVFRDGLWRDLWYFLDGKPMLMAYKSNLSRSDGLEKEIRSFFTFRANVPGYTDRRSDTQNWGWLSMYPQTVYYRTDSDRFAKVAEQITVGVAQNHNYVTKQLSAMNGPNCADRTYTSKGYDTRPDALLYGANFAEQFEYALSVDPSVVFVTGWNEWIAGRYEEWCGVKNAFPDEFNALASRDIEPSRGVLKDHYYYQFVNFVRRYKGVRPIPEPSPSLTVDINSGVSQWSDVAPYFAGYIGDASKRDAVGYGGIAYTDDSGRNDLIGAQIARDAEKIYILVECREDITPSSDPLWMNVYLDVDRENGGWNSFNYVINKTAPRDGKTSVLERFTGNGYESEYVADAAFSVSGRYLQIAINKSDLGISGDDFTINFSVTDNVHDASDEGSRDGEKTVYTDFLGDILDFYTSGDVLPGGRFKFSYVSTAANASASGTDTSENTGGTDEGSGPPSVPSSRGCRSALPFAAPLAVAISAAASATGLSAKKRKKDVNSNNC